MSKLSALHNAAHSRYNPSQPRDGNGRWAAIGNLAQNAVEKGIVAGAGAIGHHVGGEVGAVAGMLGARVVISLGKKAIASDSAKEASDRADRTLEEIEEMGMGDVFGHAVVKAVGSVVDDLAGVPYAGMAAGMAVSAGVTPHLVKAAKRLKGKMNQQTTLTPRTT